MQFFSMTAQVLGEQRSAIAESTQSGITVTCGNDRHDVRSLRAAIDLARDYLGHFLKDADRISRPWGLIVAVEGVSAVYGDWPLLSGGGPGDSRPSLVSKIRSDYKGGGAQAAIQNAIKIIETYLGRRAA